MVNRPKQKGTAAETAVLRHVVDRGFLNAYRLPLSGAKDLGDLMLGHAPRHLRVVAEVKATSRNLQLTKWMNELETEVGNWSAYPPVSDTIGLLVVKYPGVGDRSMHRWFAAMPQGWWRLPPTAGRPRVASSWGIGILPFWRYGNRVGRFVDEVVSQAPMCVDRGLVSPPRSVYRFRATGDRWLVAGGLGEMLAATRYILYGYPGPECSTENVADLDQLDINAASMQH